MPYYQNEIKEVKKPYSGKTTFYEYIPQKNVEENIKQSYIESIRKDKNRLEKDFKDYALDPSHSQVKRSDYTEIIKIYYKSITFGIDYTKKNYYTSGYSGTVDDNGSVRLSSNTDSFDSNEHSNYNINNYCTCFSSDKNIDSDKIWEKYITKTKPLDASSSSSLLINNETFKKALKKHESELSRKACKDFKGNSKSISGCSAKIKDFEVERVEILRIPTYDVKVTYYKKPYITSILPLQTDIIAKGKEKLSYKKYSDCRNPFKRSIFRIDLLLLSLLGFFAYFAITFDHLNVFNVINIPMDLFYKYTLPAVFGCIGFGFIVLILMSALKRSLLVLRIIYRVIGILLILLLIVARIALMIMGSVPLFWEIIILVVPNFFIVCVSFLLFGVFKELEEE